VKSCALPWCAETIIPEQSAREAGKMQLEGKDYVVTGGDVMHFRFNVQGSVQTNSDRSAVNLL